MMEPLISVIVPIFKVEEYLNRCVESLVNQTYKNLEIILVDDGSPDNCPEMCDQWAKKDKRIRVIHKKNGGLSDARNAGMRIATGEYIAFVDSDDYVSFEFLKTLYTVLQAENSDIAECSMLKVFEEKTVDENIDFIRIVNCSTVNAISELISETLFHQYVWNKLYKRNQIKDIFFPVGKLNEDEFWTYQVFGRARKATKINRVLYYYYQRSGSIMRESYSVRRLDALEGKANRQKYIERFFPSLASQAKIDFFVSCIFAGQSILKHLSGTEKKNAFKVVKKYVNSNKLSFREIRTVFWKNRFYLYLSRFSFYGCCKIRAVFGIGF